MFFFSFWAKGEEIPPPEYDFELELESLIGETLPLFSGVNGVANSSGSASAPRELMALLVSTRFVTLSWKPPTFVNGKIKSYAIYYKELGSDRERVLNTTQSDLEEINIQGLQPNKRYTFRIVPYDEKEAGQSSKEITVLTQPEVDVPGQPRFLKVWPVSPTRVGKFVFSFLSLIIYEQNSLVGIYKFFLILTLDLRWAPPETTNGKIERYKVFYAEASDHGYDGTELERFSTEDSDSLDDLDDEDDYLIPMNGVIQSLTVTSTEATLEDLRIYTEYFIWVVAFNSNGPGTNSDQVRVTTLSDSPSDTPHNVSAEPASSNVSLELKCMDYIRNRIFDSILRASLFVGTHRRSSLEMGSLRGTKSNTSRKEENEPTQLQLMATVYP